jgi:hypothetical protein
MERYLRLQKNLKEVELRKGKGIPGQLKSKTLKENKAKRVAITVFG